MIKNPPYETEVLDPGSDNGTMVDNVNELSELVIGHRIVGTTCTPSTGPFSSMAGKFTLTLDDGTRVELVDTDDCCASTELKSFLIHPERVDHIITGIGTTNGYTTWHIYADMGDVLEMNVNWSAGNPFYYGYGFIIRVTKETAEVTP